jgi:hypothetical protein
LRRATDSDGRGDPLNRRSRIATLRLPAGSTYLRMGQFPSLGRWNYFHPCDLEERFLLAGPSAHVVCVFCRSDLRTHPTQQGERVSANMGVDGADLCDARTHQHPADKLLLGVAKVSCSSDCAGPIIEWEDGLRSVTRKSGGSTRLTPAANQS